MNYSIAKIRAALELARDYITSDLASERGAFSGYEGLSRIDEIKADIEGNAAALAALAELEQAAGEPSITLTSGALRRALEFSDPDGSDKTTDVTIAWLESQPIDDEGTLSSGYFAWLTEYPEEGHMPIDLPEIRLPWTPDATPPPAKPAPQFVAGKVTDEACGRVSVATCGGGEPCRASRDWALRWLEAWRAELGPALWLVEIREPTPEECERIDSIYAASDRTSHGLAMFRAVRAVMWPKEGV